MMKKVIVCAAAAAAAFVIVFNFEKAGTIVWPPESMREQSIDAERQAVLDAVSAALADDDERGTKTVTVPAHQWVEPVNPDTEDWSCSIDYGDRLSESGREGEVVLARVETNGMGAQCEKGTLFFVDQSEFATMTEKYEVVRKAKQDRDALVNRMIKDVE